MTASLGLEVVGPDPDRRLESTRPSSPGSSLIRAGSSVAGPEVAVEMDPDGGTWTLLAVPILICVGLVLYIFLV